MVSPKYIMDNKHYINNSKYSKWYFDIIASIKNEPRKRLKRIDANFIYYEDIIYYPNQYTPNMLILENGRVTWFF